MNIFISNVTVFTCISVTIRYVLNEIFPPQKKLLTKGT